MKPPHTDASATKSPRVHLTTGSAAHTFVSGRLNAMGRAWCQTLPAGGLCFTRSSSLVRDCVLLRKPRWCQLSEDGIRLSSPSPHSGDAYSITGGRVEVCLRRICLCLICWDIFVVPLHSCLFMLDPSGLRYSSSAAVAFLVRWLAWRLPDCLSQQVFPVAGSMRP